MRWACDLPLAYLWKWGRALRFIDGPVEVHLRVVARIELKKAKENLGRNALFFRNPRYLYKNISNC